MNANLIKYLERHIAEIESSIADHTAAGRTEHARKNRIYLASQIARLDKAKAGN